MKVTSEGNKKSKLPKLVETKFAMNQYQDSFWAQKSP
jgi:hypothetical protein